MREGGATQTLLTCHIKIHPASIATFHSQKFIKYSILLGEIKLILEQKWDAPQLKE